MTLASAEKDCGHVTPSSLECSWTLPFTIKLAFKNEEVKWKCTRLISCHLVLWLFTWTLSTVSSILYCLVTTRIWKHKQIDICLRLTYVRTQGYSKVVRCNGYEHGHPQWKWGGGKIKYLEKCFKVTQDHEKYAILIKKFYIMFLDAN